MFPSNLGAFVNIIAITKLSLSTVLSFKSSKICPRTSARLNLLGMLTKVASPLFSSNDNNSCREFAPSLPEKQTLQPKIDAAGLNFAPVGLVKNSLM
jgi:hypothetical protein